ncbi:MAG: Ger(x)C family spore germination C-terminal domain-containing protein [Firmicutes bacterium]|nr:Ger(x)C family spore germination C-terminal domain-containing protein [Bacillota bacterium]
MRKLKKLTSRKKVRIYMLILLVLVLPFFFTANFFNNTPQVNSRSFVTTLGVDVGKDGEGIHLSAQVFLPMIEERTLQTIVLIESEGRTIMEALERLSLQNGQNVEFSQCRMIVIGDEKAKNGITSEVKSLFSNHNFCSNAMMLHAQDVSAHHFLTKTMQLNDAGGSVADFVSYYEKNESIPNVTLMSFLAGTLGESNASFMPSARLIKEKEEREEEEEENNIEEEKEEKEEENAEDGEEAEKENVGADDEVGKENVGATALGRPQDEAQAEEDQEENQQEEEDGINPEELLVYVLHDKIDNLDTVAVFKDGKLSGVLDEYQSSGLAFISGHSKRGFLMLPNFTFNGEEFENIFANVIRKNSRLRISFADDTPYIKYTISSRLLLNEKFRFLDLTSDLSEQKELYAELEQAFKKEIEKKVQSTLDVSKELDTDFLNLSYRFHRLQSNKIKEFSQTENNFLKKMKIEIEVKVRLD